VFDSDIKVGIFKFKSKKVVKINNLTHNCRIAMGVITTITDILN